MHAPHIAHIALVNAHADTISSFMNVVHALKPLLSQNNNAISGVNYTGAIVAFMCRLHFLVLHSFLFATQAFHRLSFTHITFANTHTLTHCLYLSAHVVCIINDARHVM